MEPGVRKNIRKRPIPRPHHCFLPFHLNLKVHRLFIITLMVLDAPKCRLVNLRAISNK